MTVALPTRLRTGRSRKTRAVIFVDNCDHNDVLRADCRTVTDDEADAAFAAEIVRRWNAHQALVEALRDMQTGWHYIRQNHGDLYGVGWDRCEEAARAALAASDAL